MDKLFWIFAGAVLGWAFTGDYQRRKQFKIIIKKLTMSELNLQELLTKVQGLEQSGVEVQTSLTNIAGDITAIKEGLPATGGLTEAEVAIVRTSLERAELSITAAKNAAANLDAENPAPTE